MNDPLYPAMVEATRLTQAGRLGEATALLQKLLRASMAVRQSAAPIIDGLPIIEDFTSADSAPDAIGSGGAGLHLPKALRDISDRLNLTGAAHALRGLL